jgi:hypothetical protein
VTKLLDVDAADCYLLDARRGVRCAALYGLPTELIEFEFPADRALVGRRCGGARDGVGRVREVGPHPAYEDRRRHGRSDDVVG